MPTLPRIASRGTPRLAQQDPNAPVRQAAQVNQLVRTVAGGLQQMQEEKTRMQEREAGLQMSRAMVTYEEQYGGRAEYTPDEIPQNVEIRRTDKMVAPDGVVEERPRQSVPAYEVGPDIFRSQMSAHAEAAAAGIDDEDARTRFLQLAEERINQQYVGKLRTARDEQERFNNAQLTANINQAADNGNFAAAIALAGEISNPAARQETISGLRTAQENAYYDALVLEAPDNPDSIPAMREAIEMLRDDEQPSNLSNAARLAKARALESAIDEANVAELERQEHAKQRLVSDTWLNIERGNPAADEAHIERLFENGDIEGPERTRMMLALDRQRQEQMNQLATTIDLDRIAAEGYGIDPRDKRARKAVSDRFEQYVQESGDILASGRQIMQEFRVVPDQVASMFRSANRADAPNLAQAAALFIDAQDYAPNALADFKEGDVSFIERVAANMQLGMDTPTAVETVRKYEALSPTERTSLKQTAAALTDANTESLEDLISDQPSYDIPWSVSDPDIPAFMNSEFNALVQRNLPVTGYNIEAARRTAFNTLTRTWSLTDINGDYQLMKNAPQAPTEQVRQFIGSQYRGRFTELSDFHGRKFTAKDVKIRADSRTEIELRHGKKPTYMAYVVTDPETQMIEVLDRFEWDSDKAAKSRRDQILAQGKKRFEQSQEQDERIRRGEIGGLNL